MTKKVSEAKLKKAKKLYLDHHSISEVSRETGIARSTITHHVKKDNGWEYERDLARAELINKIKSAKRSDFAQMTGSVITVLKRSLQTLAERDDAPTVQEAKGAAAILEILDKITRLDEGDPTEIIHSEKPVTVVELKSKLKLDPFADEIKEVEFENAD